jgi:hypothetical protein
MGKKRFSNFSERDYELVFERFDLGVLISRRRRSEGGINDRDGRRQAKNDDW